MNTTERLLWAIAILVVDGVTFFLPVTALAAAYILIARPVWFKDWVGRIYQ